MLENSLGQKLSNAESINADSASAYQEFCKNHNLKLIRIPYSDYKYINEQYLLTKILEE